MNTTGFDVGDEVRITRVVSDLDRAWVGATGVITAVAGNTIYLNANGQRFAALPEELVRT